MSYTESEIIEWHRIIMRPMTEEEVADYKAQYGESEEIPETYDCELPDDDEEVMIDTIFGIRIVDFSADSSGVYFDDYRPNEILAWAEMPRGVSLEKQGE